ncbi:MAG: J domain-containing protein [Treponema sp.]|nr:J domain-containing protein [Treponema sp.]
MGIFGRLSKVINSYLNDFENDTSSRLKSSSIYRDPDLDAAYEELDDYLNRREPRQSGQRRHDFNFESERHDTRTAGKNLPPEELRADFEILGVPFGADDDTCKAAYKKLLKIHHPDRHAGHEGNYKKATEKSAKINAAVDRIEKWRKTQEG